MLPEPRHRARPSRAAGAPRSRAPGHRGCRRRRRGRPGDAPPRPPGPRSSGRTPRVRHRPAAVLPHRGRPPRPRHLGRARVVGRRPARRRRRARRRRARSTRGEGDAAFCAVRPPGHHATPDRAMGFCLLNNVAVAAAALADRGERVLIVDWDAHHGNGTQDVFYADPRVLYVSMHEWPLYPGTGRLDEIGAGAGAGTTVNFPLPGRARPATSTWRRSTRSSPRDRRRFAPTWLLVSAGLRRPPRRPAHRPRPRGGRLRRPHRPRCSRSCRPGGAVRVPRGRLRPARRSRSSAGAPASAALAGVGLPPRAGHLRGGPGRAVVGRRAQVCSCGIRRVRPGVDDRGQDVAARAGSERAAALPDGAAGLRPAHQGRLAAVRPRRRPARADPVRRGDPGRHRAHGVRHHAQGPGRRVHRRSRGRLRLQRRRPRPLPRERLPPARIGRPRASGGCCPGIPSFEALGLPPVGAPARRGAARAGARHRPDRLGQDDDARRDDRPHQRDARPSTS